MAHTPPVQGSPASALEPVRTAQAHEPRRRRPPHLSAWLPGLSMMVLVAAVLRRYGVSVPDMAAFGAYVAVGLALPGTLLVRALYGGARTAAEEIALGVTLGYSVEVILYIGARAVGMPLLVLVWPIAVSVLFAGVPRLRRHWRRGREGERAPLWWSWCLALLFAFLVVWSALSFFRTHAITWPELGAASIDMPFHLALVGELKHHVPPMVPMVAGEPLLYHWFVYAHLAAASWITGVEPLVLVFRLAMLPMLAALVVLLGMTGRRVTGSWAGGALTAAGTIFVAVPSLYLGTNGSFTWGGVPDLAWTSPTQTFGALLFAPVVLILMDVLAGRRQTAGTWVLLGVFLLAVMGGKASYLPLLAAGLAAVAVVEAVRRRRAPWPALAALGMTTALCLYAQFILFGGVRQGLVVSPLFTMRTTWGELTGLGDQADPPVAAVTGITLIYVLCWFVVLCGVLGLASRPRSLGRPGVVLLLGIGAAGLGTMFLLGHPGRSQLFFLWGAYPYLVTVTVHGLLVLLRRARVSLRSVLCSAGAGVVAAYLIPVACGVRVPLSPGQADTILYRPYVALSAVAVVVSVVLIATRGALRAWALVTTMLTAIGLPADLHARVLSTVDRLTGHDPPVAAVPVAAPAVPPGALTAGRWLRAHSDPDDLVATNAHCRWGYEDPCDSRHFWVSALSERRVLVEGWTYTAANLRGWRQGQSPEHIPFWDQELLRANDAAFTAPSEAVLQRLRDRYGVRWLFFEGSRTVQNPAAGRFAFRSGDYTVYELK
ncbi:hypothetical protein ACOZ38_13420 [Sphaerisporangium viridialbum]|uniref:hypothetical protein n=1 Tax=Sphaerisporangium viridialbum TaxID=46189 RepID=UPI003C7316A6